jgi:hypothetical protein
LRRRLRRLDEALTAKPDAALVEYLHIPENFVSPARKIFMRVLYALAALFAAVLIVYLDRDGYRDIESAPVPGGLSFLDCLYYATVSLSTTGYGDITPVTETARLVNVLVITPLRVAFLIVLIGTTVETLTAASRQALKIQRWRNSVRNQATTSNPVTSWSSTPIRRPWTGPARPVWSPSVVTPTAPMSCAWPALSTPRPSSWPPTAIPPRCSSR